MASTAKSSNNVSTPEGLPEIKVGELFAGAYRIIRLLGEGGMGAVYLVRDTRSVSRLVALKILRPGKGLETQPVPDTTMSRDLTVSSGAQAAEARLLASCEHPSILPVYDAGTDPATGLSFFTMRPCLVSRAGLAHICDDVLRCPYPRSRRRWQEEPCALSLKNVLEGGKALPEAAVARIGIDLADALQYLHGRTPPVIHRDIKPSNILFDNSGRAILSDFGIAQSLRVDDAGRKPFTHSTFQPFNSDSGRHARAGTPFYASPEQRSGAPVSAATDFYSLGVVLHEALTGERTVGGGPPSTFDPAAISADWDALLPRLLAEDPAARLCDPAEIRRALEAIANRGPRRRRAWRLSAVAAAALAAVSIAVSVLGPWGGARGESPNRPADAPSDPFERVADVARKIALFRSVPVWPVPSSKFFPEFFFPPRPENMRRFTLEHIWEMRLPGDVPMQFVPITPGENHEAHRYREHLHGWFQDPGSNSRPTSGERDSLRVIVPKRILVGRTEVTERQFAAVMESATNAIPMWNFTFAVFTNAEAMAATGIDAASYNDRFNPNLKPLMDAGADLSSIRATSVMWPVNRRAAAPQGMPAANGIRFADVGRFIDKLNSLCPPGCTFRLPTEAEWESVCRCATNLRFEGDDPDAVCWSRENSGGAPHPVARKKPNAYGAYDFHGNVAEWCLDGFAPLALPAFDPLAPVPPDGRHVVKGGSWADAAGECGSEARRGAGPDETGIGFRLVLEY